MTCRRIVSLGVIAVVCGLMLGCHEDEPGGDLEKINDAYHAKMFVADDLMAGVVYRNVVSGLAQGTHNGTSVSGSKGGTAEVSGRKSYSSGVSCGSDCVRSFTDNDLTIEFRSFHVMSNDNTEALVTGTITYTDNTWSQQSGLSHSSGGDITGAGSGVSASFLSAGSLGFEDNVTFSASSTSVYWMTSSGTCTGSSGSYSW